MKLQEGHQNPLMHAVVVPFPAQGHVNPLINFAKLLASRGFYITFIFKKPDDAAAASSRLEQHGPGLKFRFLSVPDGLPPEHGKESKSPENLITCLPGKIPPLWPIDLLSLYRTRDALFDLLLYESDIHDKADYVLVNSFEELEGKEAMQGLSNGYPALAIGPVFLPNLLEGREYATSMWEENPKCLQWLDMQKPLSVLYVSFGSIAVKSQQQLHEIALGLEGSEQPFLWVIRSDIADRASMVLPEGFEDRTKDRALLVQWAPQLKVLSHPSVGGFLTHSGWNSTVESISMGVPMIGWPYFGDQSLNCRFAKDVWKVGLDMNTVMDDGDHEVLVKKEKVEMLVRTLMKEPHGHELRKQAQKLKADAAMAVTSGGSSFKNLEKFVEDIRKRASSHI
eukprot:Gb_03938 [translate_table: standard]